MGLLLLAYPDWFLYFLGAVSTILVANLIQWLTRRERIYGLYTVYILVWMGLFLAYKLPMSAGQLAFIRTMGLPCFSIIYFELAIQLLNLKSHPALLRWYRVWQGAFLVYCLPEIYFHFFSALWQTDWHEILLNTVRLIIFTGTNLTIIYTVFRYADPSDKLARFFGTGTIAMLVTEFISIIPILRYGPQGITKVTIPLYPEFIIQVGILIDLACVSLGLSYRQRQQAQRQVIVEQELIREREQRVRQHLEADLALERLKQEKTEMQMRALQSRVNPHFLFNSLNTLSSLIDENQQLATDYVDELSSVYRYLLRAGDHDLTTLRQELGFIQSYFHLLKTRYGAALGLELGIQERQLEATMPPLTLQLLMENAVKHNVALPDQPLTIRIYTTPLDKLVVENNMQRRTVRVESNGVGLSNITDKYRLLSQAAPRIEEVDGWFRVTLPLLPLSTQMVTEPT